MALQLKPTQSSPQPIEVEEYDIVVDENEVRGLRTVGEAVEYIEKLTKEA